jgi:DNA-binding response OmpR family regulator
MPQTALIVDDDKELLDILLRFLSGRGFSVISAQNGELGLKAALSKKPDIVITDVEMPSMDGLALCGKIKASPQLGNTPVIIMSGKKISESDLVGGYGMGADDYVIKPFSYLVLLAKVRALLRRAGRESAPAATLKRGGLTLDIEARSASLKGKRLRLTSKEFDLLALLIKKAGRVATFSTLLEDVWGHNPASYNDPHTVKVHASNLRKKLGTEGKHIVAVPGHGYKFE